MFGVLPGFFIRLEMASAHHYVCIAVFLQQTAYIRKQRNVQAFALSCVLRLYIKRSPAGDNDHDYSVWSNSMMHPYNARHYDVTRHAAGNYDRAYENYDHPHGNYGHPYGNYGHPYGNYGHAYGNYGHPHDSHSSYALSPGNIEYGAPRTEYGVGSTYAHEHSVSNMNRLRAAYSYGHAHGAGMDGSPYAHAARLSSDPTRYHHNSAAGYVPGHYRHDPFLVERSNVNVGRDHCTENLRNRISVGEDCVDLNLDDGRGAVTGLVNAVVKKGASVVHGARWLHDVEYTGDHPGLWKEYLTNPNYTQDVTKAIVDNWTVQYECRLHGLWFLESKVFCTEIKADYDNDVQRENWTKPDGNKEMEVIVQAAWLAKSRKNYGTHRAFIRNVVRSEDTPKEMLSKDILFECFPPDMTEKDIAKFKNLPRKERAIKWSKMHPGRKHKWETFAVG